MHYRLWIASFTFFTTYSSLFTMETHTVSLQNISSDNLKTLCNRGLDNMQSTWSKENYKTFLKYQTSLIASTKSFTYLYYITALLQKTKSFAQFEDKNIYLGLPKMPGTSTIKTPHGEIFSESEGALYHYVVDPEKEPNAFMLVMKLQSSPLSNSSNLSLKEWFEYQKDFLPVLESNNNNLKKIFASYIYQSALTYCYKTIGILVDKSKALSFLHNQIIPLSEKYDSTMNADSKKMLTLLLDFTTCIFTSRIQPIVSIANLYKNSENKNWQMILIKKMMEQNLIRSQIPKKSIRDNEEILYKALYQSLQKTVNSKNLLFCKELQKIISDHREDTLLPQNLWGKN